MNYILFAFSLFILNFFLIIQELISLFVCAQGKSLLAPVQEYTIYILALKLIRQSFF